MSAVRRSCDRVAVVARSGFWSFLRVNRDRVELFFLMCGVCGRILLRPLCFQLWSVIEFHGDGFFGSADSFG